MRRLHANGTLAGVWTIGAIIGGLVGHGGCSKSPVPQPATIHLVDQFKPTSVESRVPTTVSTNAKEPARTEWRFDAVAPASAPAESAATAGWQAGHDVSELKIENGRLTGRTTGDCPLVSVERTTGLDSPDLLHAVEVRMSASAGANLAVIIRERPKLDFEEICQMAKDLPVDLISTPILSGTDLRTYTIRPQFNLKSSDLRHVLIRPTDAAGARFEIESVRLIFRKEHLASIPSGLSWQGLSEVYHDCLVARVPEVIRFDVSLPERPWFDLAVGTIEDGPVTFEVQVQPTDNGAQSLNVPRTITTAHRWESVPIDLSPLAGRSVTIRLALKGAAPGALGFWGSPVVRNLRQDEGDTKRARGDETPQCVILIWADTLRRDHLDVYGYPRETAPALRRMAGEGLLFRDCLTQATWTKVSTPSLMTGLYPSSHTVKEFGDHLPASAVTLAERMREAGYATLSLSSILFTGKFTNLHQGFEELHESGSVPKELHSKTAKHYVDRLLPWLESHRRVPFFVFLHVADPHDPYEPPPPYDALWAQPRDHDEQMRDMEKVRGFIQDPLMKLFGMPSRQELEKAGIDPDRYVRRAQVWYDGSIRGMDAEIGRLLERLKTLGLESKTLILFTGDHGEEFLEHGRMFHGQTVYGELNRVPLILWGPGVLLAGRVVEQTVETIDLMPTILEMCHQPTPPEVQGHSLLALIRGDSGSGAWPDRPAVTEKAMTNADGGGPPPHETESIAVARDGWKLVDNVRRAAGQPEYELYNHRTDPLNLVDLAAKEPQRVASLVKDLAAWRERISAVHLESDETAGQHLSSEDLERLRSLGYVK